jgi:hypothetical protein
VHWQAEREGCVAERKELERSKHTVMRTLDAESIEVRREAERQKLEAQALEKDRALVTEKVRHDEHSVRWSCGRRVTLRWAHRWRWSSLCPCGLRSP